LSQKKKKKTFEIQRKKNEHQKKYGIAIRILPFTAEKKILNAQTRTKKNTFRKRKKTAKNVTFQKKNKHYFFLRTIK